VTDHSELDLCAVEFLTLTHLGLLRVLEASLPRELEHESSPHLDALAATILETPGLLRHLMETQDVLLEAEEAARETFDWASDTPTDEGEIECAVAMALASDRARADEAAARTRWIEHQRVIEASLVKLHEIMGAVEPRRARKQLNSLIARWHPFRSSRDGPG